MTCEELRSDYLLYAMGTMAEPESSEMRAHLDRGCPTCTEGLRQAHALAYSMGALVNGPGAPRGLRGRVMAIAGPEKNRRFPAGFRWQVWALAAACLTLALVPAWLSQQQSSRFHAKEAETAALLDRERLSEAYLRAELARQAGQSAGAVPIYALELERGADATPKQLVIPNGATSIVLALPSDVVRQASTAELRNASGQTVWSVSPLPVSDADSTGLNIPTDRLSSGRYTVALLAKGQAVGRLQFEVVKH